MDVLYKMFIVVLLKEELGVFFKALACFSLRDINMIKIELWLMCMNFVMSVGVR